MDLTELFCDVDDFVKRYNRTNNLQIEDSKFKRSINCRLSASEIMTICIAYHQSGYKNFKAFYLNYVIPHLKRQFPTIVSYNRFIELMPKVTVLLSAYLVIKFSKVTGISFVDSTPIQICKPKRMSRNKVFKDVAAKAKSTIGWFFWFKLHLFINDCGDLLALKFTKGNVDDRTPILDMVKNIFGKLFGDKGYISSNLGEKLLNNGIILITEVKKNMKNKLLTLEDKILLRKRSIIETVNDQLKNISNIEHSMHRSISNFIVNLLCALIACTLQPKKPYITKINELLMHNLTSN